MTGSSARIDNLDSIRGLAVLGILVVNLMVFAWPMTITVSPETAPFAIDGVWPADDRLFNWVSQVFFQDRFRNLFTLLFGVSLFLVGGETSDKDRSRVLLRRLGWLAIIGLLHGLLLWFGDILLFYAWCGLIAMFARSLSGRLLVIIGGGITAAWGFIQFGGGLIMPHLPAEFLEAMSDNQSMSAVTGDIAQVIANYHAGLGSALAENFKAWLFVQLSSLFVLPFSSVPIMWLGMGLYKLGFFHGRMNRSLYVTLIVISAVVLAVRGWAFNLELSAPAAQMPSYGLDLATSGLSVLVSLGYASVLILLPALFRWLMPVGRMAFSTYLGQSLIMASIFYLPFGPMLYGKLEPSQFWGLLAGVWAFQIGFAAVWLRYFRWGPMEWVWRCLTHRQKLAIRKHPA